MVKDQPQLVEMFFCHPQEYDNVIQIDEAVNEAQFTQAVLHQSLECGQHIACPKRHVVTFKEPQIADGKAVNCLDVSSI